MTGVSFGERAATGCPCGRSHPPTGAFRRPSAKPDPELAAKVYAAYAAGKAKGLEEDLSGSAKRIRVAYHSDCAAPLTIKRNDTRNLFAEFTVRCRRCGPCLRARTNYWGFAAMAQTVACQGRTWFGTLTFNSDWQEEMLVRARMASDTPTAEWWEEASCDERFRLVRAEMLRELQRFWKRLRSKGHRFGYLAVFERHKSGLPHIHWLLHERGEPIRKRELQAEWPFGFTNVVLVGGKARKAAAPEKAAWYVVKYLSKSTQARQIASRGYTPLSRSEP